MALVRYDCNTPGRPRGLFRDRDSGLYVRWVIWADVGSEGEPGNYEAWRYAPVECKVRFAAGQPRAELVEQGRKRLMFVPLAAGLPGKATPERDLVESLEEGRRRFARARPLLLIPGLPVPECDEPKCHRPAWWSVSDEQEILPRTDEAGAKHERAVTIRPRFYCSSHYRPPVFTNLRGVESEVAVEVGRPQWGR